MKKLLLGFVLIVLLFNLIGDQLIMYLYELNSTNNIETKIDKNAFQDNELVIVEIPLNLPYYSDMEQNVAYGETTIDGKYYRYVKRKVKNNVLQLYCISNNDKNKLVSLRKNLESTKKNDKEQSKNSIPKNLKNDFYCNKLNDYLINKNVVIVQKYLLTNTAFISLISIKKDEKPPDHI